MSIVLQCPVCQSSFQVLPEQAGQLVACPTCNETVSIPSDIAPESTSVPEVFGCPHCQGQFGITPDMIGSEVACPHCERPVRIESKTKPVQTSSPPQKAPKPADEELFAPGYKKSKTNSENKKQNEEPKTSERKSRSRKLPPVQRRERKGAQAQPTNGDKAKSKIDRNPLDLPEPPPKSTSKPENKKPELPKPKISTLEDKKDPKKASESAAVANESIGSKNTQPASPPATSTTELSEDSERLAAREKMLSIAKRLLPPRFTAIDGDELRMRASRVNSLDPTKVLLPDGDGGFKQIDNRVVHIERDGEKLQLYAKPKEQRERNRLIQNLIAIVFGIIILGLVYLLLV